MKKRSLRAAISAAISVALIFLLYEPAHAQQMADPNFKTSVESPAFSKTHPIIAIDEAHSNFHTAEGRYKPLADLLRSDGYKVERGKKKFSKESLKGISILIISNAVAPDAENDSSAPAFADQECDVVRDWVKDGGSLLLIADHTPFGSAAEGLAKRFDVDMGKGYVFDAANSEGSPTLLVFSRTNGLLGDHPIIQGRSPSEEVMRIISFTGQSLGAPEGAVVLMKLGPDAYESPNHKELQASLDSASKNSTDQKFKVDKDQARSARSVGGRAQGIAMKFGKGRLVILGEAAMLSAQVIRFKEGDKEQEFKMGMNVPGNDDRQFALNIIRWLSGLLK